MNFLITIAAAIAFLLGIFLVGIIGTWLIELFFGLDE
jgi:uncharacterized membrane protein